MARARELIFYSQDKLTEGQLVILSNDGVDEQVAHDEFELDSTNLRVRAKNPKARFEDHRVIAKFKVTENGIVTPFDNQQIADRLASMINSRANQVRAEQGKKKD